MFRSMQSKLVHQLQTSFHFSNLITRNTLIFVSRIGYFDEKLMAFAEALNRYRISVRNIRISSLDNIFLITNSFFSATEF